MFFHCNSPLVNLLLFHVKLRQTSSCNTFQKLWALWIPVYLLDINTFTPEQQRLLQTQLWRWKTDINYLQPAGLYMSSVRVFYGFYGLFLLIQCGSNTPPEARNDTWRCDLITTPLCLHFIANLAAPSADLQRLWNFNASVFLLRLFQDLMKIASDHIEHLWCLSSCFMDSYCYLFIA